MQASAEEYGPPPSERSIRWRGIAASLLLHLALIEALLGWWLPAAPPEPAPPLIHVVFGDPGAAGAAGGSGGQSDGQGDAAASQSASTAAPDATAEQAEATPPPPASAPEPTPPSTEAAQLTPPAPVPTPVPAPAPTPVPALRPEPKIAEAPPPLPQHKPPPHPTRVASARPAPAKPPVPAPAPAPAPAAEAPAASASANAAAPGSGNGAGTLVGQGQGTEGAGRGVFGDGTREGPGDEYLEKLRRWLAKYKQYPQAAIDKKEEGQVIIGFTLKRDGTVLTAWIERSSGNPLLDEAALAMMHRASPVPPIPDRYKGNELKLAMPIDYSIGFFERLFR
jgi:protein TonB